MLETQRHQYLTIMGIDNYMPTKILPQAPQPIAYPWSQEPNQTPVTKKDTQKINTPTPPTPPQKITKTDPPKQPDKPLKPSPNNPPQPLHLTIWQTEHLLIIDSRATDQALPTETLLDNLIHALGYPIVPKPKILQWPPIKNTPSIEKHPNGGKDMLIGFLDNEPSTHWLLMGDHAQIVLQHHHPHNTILPSTALDHPFKQTTNPQIATLPSLAEILQNPDLKPTVWQTLKQLNLPKKRQTP